MNKNNISSARDALESLGWVKLSDFFTNEDVASAISYIKKVEAAPSKFSLKKTYGDATFLMDFAQYRRVEGIEHLYKNLSLTRVLRDLANSGTVRFMHDDVIVKTGYGHPETPAHHDRPYFYFKGKKNLSVWIALDDFEQEESIYFMDGSHKDRRLFLPKNFLSGESMHKKRGFHELTSTILSSWSRSAPRVKRGDILVFFNTTVHGALPPKTHKDRHTLVLRYLGDDALVTTHQMATVPPYKLWGLKVEDGAQVPSDMFPLLD